MDVNLRFRVTQAYATRSGFVGGVPTFFTATYPDKIVYGSLLISQRGAEWRDVPISILHPKNPDDFVSLVKDVMTYATEWGYEAGFPTFFRGVATDLETTFGTILFKPGNVTIQYIPSSSFDGIAQDDIGGRFRMVQQIATKAGFVGGFPTFVQEERLIRRDDGSVYRGLTDAVVMLPDGTATFRDLPKEGLNDPNLDDPAQHVRSMQARATEDGFVGAIPTFFTAESGGFVCGTLLLDAQAAEWRDVPVDDLGDPPSDDQAGRFRASQGYADREGFVGAFPTFFQADEVIHRIQGPSTETVNGTVLIKAPSEWRDVRAADLGNPPDDDGPARFRATQVYAGANGAIGGFPNFNQVPAGPNQEMVYGTILLQGPGVTFRDVNYKELFTGDIIRGAIWDHWQALGGPSSFLGLPLTEELSCIDGVGRFNRFDGGMIFFTPSTGAWEVHGAILDHWNSLGAERSYLGYPTSDEGDYIEIPTNERGRISKFQYGKIVWLNGVASDIPDSVSKHADVSTPAGTALGGGVDLILYSNGNYTQTISMQDTGTIGYDFDIHYAFSTPNGLVLTDHWAGHVAGSLTSGSSDFSSSQPLFNPMIRKLWADVTAKESKLDIIKDYSPTGVGGFFLNLSQTIFDLGAGAVGAALGIIIGSTSLIGTLLPSFGPGQTLGILDGVIVFALGGGILMATVQGIAVGATVDLIYTTRPMRDDERTFADEVFKKSIDFNQIRVTNLSGLGGRPFTVLGSDNLIYVNMGRDAYEKDPKLFVRNDSDVAGQTFIHELTHAWQIQNAGLVEITICKGITEQADYQVGEDVYTFGPAGPDWTEFGNEQQASIVEHWFHNGQQESDDYFRYIRDNIRKKNG